MTVSDKTSWNRQNWQALQQELDRLRNCLSTAIAGNEPLEYAPSPLPETTAIAELARKFHLSPFDRDILLLCLGSEIDRAIPQLCAKAQGDDRQNYPTLGLALSFFPHAT